MDRMIPFLLKKKEREIIYKHIITYMYLYISRKEDIYQIIKSSYLWEMELPIGGRDIMQFCIGFFLKTHVTFVIINVFLK